MAEKNILMQRKTATGYDTYYPKTKVANVEGAAKASDLDAKMHATTGHKHDGTAGNGPVLDSIMLAHDAPFAGTALTFNKTQNNGAWKSVGPSGAGADISWPELNDVPPDARGILLGIVLVQSHSATSNSASSEVCLRKLGSAVTPAARSLSVYTWTSSGSNRASYVVPLALVQRKFEFAWYPAMSYIDTATVSFYCIGWF